MEQTDEQDARAQGRGADERWEVVIVGGGAAGLSAALVLGRARRWTLVLDAGEQSNRPAHGIGGLLGHDGLAPAELYRKGRQELRAYPSVEVRDARVTGGAPDEGGGFVLSTAAGEVVRAERVVLATGMTYAVPDLPGLAPLWGDTAFHCPYCHGWEVRDGALAVLGAGHGVHRALLLQGWSRDVVLLTDGPAELDDAERSVLSSAGITVDERPVAGVTAHDGRLSAVVFADGTELPRDGLLVFSPLRQRTGLAEELGAALDERGAVDVDGFGRTTVPGLYAAGDVSTLLPQVAAAVAEGSRVAAVLNGDALAEHHGIAPMIPARTAA
jgi:thioredoxin reductase